jgi:hypothetical protein
VQFVKDGPDVPDDLLEHHEDGSVVFFCGAGISYPAGLPGFGDLVKAIYLDLHATPDAIEAQALDRFQYDATIDLLEHRLTGGREAVRGALARALRPRLRRVGAKDTHQALLTLARNDSGDLRLVTTNFDRIFETVMRDPTLRTPIFQAPFLPIPKDSKWNGLVYLHGLLPKLPTTKDLNRLVVSSGDFGLAYLTERWASRFVSELFRNYIVCFVGYSIGDPVLRYMMDALAADRMLGESTLPTYAFAQFESGKQRETEREWLAKRVSPILYGIPAGTHNHSALHRTLKGWADTHRDGVYGKEQIIVRHAMTKPAASTRQDDFVGRVIWALSDKRGLPAKRFADLDPPPALDWLAPMFEQRFRHGDLVRFKVAPNETPDDKLKFSLISRPSPYGLSVWMALTRSGAGAGGWDEVIGHLARWLTHHLDDESLILWIAARGGSLHPHFVMLVRESLTKSPPRPLMRTLWNLILADRLKNPTSFRDLYQWFRDLAESGSLTATLRTRLRQMLSPRVTLSKPFRLSDDVSPATSPVRIKDIVNWDVVLAADYVHSALRDSGTGNAIWQASLGELLGDFSDLLREVFDLMRELGGAGDLSDLSYIHQLSIANHDQNQRFYDWTALVELVRDSWMAVAASQPELARAEVTRWQGSKYPIFRRLTLYAASNRAVFTPNQALTWLLADESWWLWSAETQREALGLMTNIVPHLNDAELQLLEQSILKGPPRDMYKGEIPADRWREVVNHSVALRLTKWSSTGKALEAAGAARLNSLLIQNPSWSLPSDERSDFPFWMGTSGDWREFVPVPTAYREIPAWLESHAPSEYQQRDDWQERCKSDFKHAAWALLTLARKDSWPAGRWREALQVWSDDLLRTRSWRWVRKALAQASDEFILEISHAVIWWLRPMADAPIQDDEAWLHLVERVLSVQRVQMQVVTDDPVGKAINHPVGLATEAILHWWYQTPLEDNQRLPERLKAILTALCNPAVKSFRHGRVILAAHVITLFRVDREWSAGLLLPLFDWNASNVEARSVWEGFLWTPRIHLPFLEAIHSEFLETALHYEELGEHAEQYAAFFTFVALQPGESFSPSELASALLTLPTQGLARSVKALVRALQGAGEQSAEYWKNRVVRFMDDIWPKSVDYITDPISTAFAELCVASRDAFPDAWSRLKNWLRPLNRPDYPVHLLKESSLCERFPTEALAFLDSIVVGDTAEWPPSDLLNCLRQIESARPALTRESRFRRLSDYARQRDLST